MKQEDSKSVTEVKPTNNGNAKSKESTKETDRQGYRNNVASKVEGCTGRGLYSLFRLLRRMVVSNLEGHLLLIIPNSYTGVCGYILFKILWWWWLLGKK